MWVFQEELRKLSRLWGGGGGGGMFGDLQVPWVTEVGPGALEINGSYFHNASFTCLFFGRMSILSFYGK